MAQVIIYSTSTCPYCVKAKEFLKQNNVEYEDYDVSTNTEKRDEMIEKSGSTSVPVLDIDGEIIIGFDLEKIKEKLKI